MTPRGGPLDEHYWRDFFWGMVGIAAVGVGLRVAIMAIDWWLI